MPPSSSALGTARGLTARIAHCLPCAAQKEHEDEQLIVTLPLSARTTIVPAFANECESERCDHPCRYGIVVRVGFMFDECRARRKWH